MYKGLKWFFAFADDIEVSGEDDRNSILYEDLGRMFGFTGCKLYSDTPFNPICWLRDNQVQSTQVHPNQTSFSLMKQRQRYILLRYHARLMLFLDENYDYKFSKYMPLCQAIQQAEHDTNVLVFKVGSLGGVHHRVVPGLQLLGYGRGDSGKKAKYLSIYKQYIRLKNNMGPASNVPRTSYHKL